MSLRKKGTWLKNYQIYQIQNHRHLPGGESEPRRKD